MWKCTEAGPEVPFLCSRDVLLNRAGVKNELFQCMLHLTLRAQFMYALTLPLGWKPHLCPTLSHLGLLSGCCLDQPLDCGVGKPHNLHSSSVPMEERDRSHQQTQAQKQLSEEQLQSAMRKVITPCPAMHQPVERGTMRLSSPANKFPCRNSLPQTR